MTLLDLMKKEGVPRSYETYLILLRTWLDLKAYSAFVLVVRDMQKQGMPLPFALINDAFQASEMVRDRMNLTASFQCCDRRVLQQRPESTCFIASTSSTRDRPAAAPK